ncbi:hypothetical protein GCM10022243_64250 [Saccharothrix violaceirubra]|uniref:Uncharacterized protein n=1 Tax=Saccharothrix violaceirubra TaxID=413306 RepID=A0A7W7WZA2_9PSEU|nr:hypothetical protein [Saccharothrix violaceirubra]MBB4969092.1 hypothetical protein [Saccharothrix violaceirubra]
MGELFSLVDLLGEPAIQLSIDDALAEVAEQNTAAATVENDVMPSTWELIPRETITGQGVLGA